MPWVCPVLFDSHQTTLSFQCQRRVLPCGLGNGKLLSSQFIRSKKRLMRADGRSSNHFEACGRSIKTKEACEAERGIFHPYIFTWMLHIFPYEDNFKEVFSLNDDVAHVHYSLVDLSYIKGTA